MQIISLLGAINSTLLQIHNYSFKYWIEWVSEWMEHIVTYHKDKIDYNLLI